MRVPLLNFERGPGALPLNFEGGPGVPLLNFEGESLGPGTQGPGPTFTPCRYSVSLWLFMKTLNFLLGFQ